MSPNYVCGSRLPGLNPLVLTPLAVVLDVVLQAAPALAQTVVLPTGQQGAYTNNQTGQAGAAGTGDYNNPQDGSPAPAGPGQSGDGYRMGEGAIRFTHFF